MDVAQFEGKVLGGLYGLLIGDAIGVPYEFTKPEHLPSLELIDIEPPPGFQRAHAAAPPGAWSDDGAQALCLLASLLQCGHLDIDDFSRRLLKWYEHGYMAVDYVVFDVGVQTSVALSALKSGVAVERAAPATELHNGNGSLMRVLPLALWHTGSDEQLIVDAARQSIPTHAHVRSQVCCALYCMWARAVLSGFPDSWRRACDIVRAFSQTRHSWRDELDLHIVPDGPPCGRGSGYVVDCLHSARFALEESTYERVIQRAISLGDDTDTTAAVAGGIAGLRFGLEAIPQRWRLALRSQHLVENVARQLLVHLRSRSIASV